jgi:hypothetical protein
MASTVDYVRITRSDRPEKKLKAVFYLKNGRTKTTHFGAAGMSDYTKHRDKDRQARYLARHRTSERWTDMFSAGSLSRWILWNKPSLAASIRDYGSRFRVHVRVH